MILNIMGVLAWGAWAAYFAFADNPHTDNWFICFAFLLLALRHLSTALEDA